MPVKFSDTPPVNKVPGNIGGKKTSFSRGWTKRRKARSSSGQSLGTNRNSRYQTLVFVSRKD